jgi:hypothetical protein
VYAKRLELVRPSRAAIDEVGASTSRARCPQPRELVRRAHAR